MMHVETREGENPFCHLMFQICGMMLGIGIMLLIALFENDIKNMLEWTRVVRAVLDIIWNPGDLQYEFLDMFSL